MIRCAKIKDCRRERVVMMRLDVAKVTSLLREKIGAMSAGDALPGIRVLMKEYGVSQSLVQQAYVLLKQECLIEVRDGSGTYVTEKGGLRKILWVCGIDILHGDISPYFSHVLRYCKAACAEQGLSLDHVWLSNFRPEDSASYCTPDLLSRYEGFLFCGCAEDHQLMNFVNKNQMPFSVMTHYLSEFPHRVVADLPKVLVDGFVYLKEKGATKVVYVTSDDGTYDDVYRDAAVSVGINLRKLCYPKELWTVDTERQAYLNMCREIRDHGLPSAIYIQDDIAAKGTTRAIIELCDQKTIKASDIVISCSRQNIIPLGLKVAYLVTDIEETAGYAVGMLCDQLSGDRKDRDTVIMEKCKLVEDIEELMCEKM